MPEENDTSHIDELYRPFKQYCLGLPYKVRSAGLYTSATLYDKYQFGHPETLPLCFDSIVTDHFHATGGARPTNVDEKLARDIHDHFVMRKLAEKLAEFDPIQVLGFMGGHAALRSSDSYRQAAKTGKALSELGYVILTGGGPGTMEAAHLGAHLAFYPDDALDDALAILSEAPDFYDPHWLDAALRVKERYPSLGRTCSISIPTWLFNHEPSNIFPTYIAKLFENSVREQVLLIASFGGLLAFQGGSGTMQEIFQKAQQNHSKSFGDPAPLVLVGREFWGEKLEIDKLFQRCSKYGVIRNALVNIVDTPEEAVEVITDYKIISQMFSEERRAAFLKELGL